MNPYTGIPKTSYNEKSSPTLDNATWFSMMGLPPSKSPKRTYWSYDPMNNKWRLEPVWSAWSIIRTLNKFKAWYLNNLM